MSDKTFVGLDITGFENTGKYRPVSRITLMVDDENVYTAGDDTGFELSASCPHATQEMANTLLAQLHGYQYQSFTADAANLDPAAELGDGVTVNGIYSIISRVEDDGHGFPNISSPGEVALEEEYPSAGPMTQEFNRKIAETRSTISKTSEEIRLEVSNELNGLSASIDLKLDSITSQITGINGQVSSITQTVSGIQTQITGLNNQVSSIDQKVDSIDLSVSNGTSSSRILLTVDGVQVSSATVRFTGDIVFESDLAGGRTTVSGDCITTGEISARYIKLGGQMEVYESLRSSADVGGYIGYMTGMSSAGSTTSGIAITNYTERALMICTSSGARMGYDGVNTVVCTSSQVSINGDTVFINGEPQSASDARLKTDVQYDVDGYLTVFDRLKPATFVYNGHKRRHMGFLAQEIQETLKEEGIPEEHFAALCTEVPNEERPMGMYSLRYGELQIMTVAKVQQMDKRLKELEAKLVG